MEPSIFQKRREEFMTQMDKGIAIFFAAPTVLRNGDSRYPYRADSSFYYLTGYAEEQAIAILAPGTEHPFRLFVQPRDPARELWVGKRMGVKEAEALLKPDLCLPLASFEEEFSKLLKRAGRVYYPMSECSHMALNVQRQVHGFRPNLRLGEQSLEGVFDTTSLLASQRVVKDDSEIALMRKNGKNSARAHCSAMSVTRPGKFEYQIAAEIESAFFKGGAEALAYPSIVGGGNNATVLHYCSNRDELKEGSLLLIDAGGEMNLYASDITRTFPVNGKFTEPQRNIYRIVLEAQKQVIAMVRPGIAYHSMHDRAVEVIVEGLLDLGLLEGEREKIIEKKAYLSFFPHGTGHWLGLDVHDVGNYFTPAGESMSLVSGNIFTVEPGIYIGGDREDVAAEYRGIGVRIEDDVLVTEGGCEVFTSDVPKEISEIEALVGSAN